MSIRTEEDIVQLIKDDHWMMDILRATQTLRLPDWWVCAGFVRAKIWDSLQGFSSRTPLADVDVIYFDSTNVDESEEKKFEEKLRLILPNVPWSVKNEARMHLVNDIPPYLSSVDAISKFPETVTSLGVTLDGSDRVILAAPHGVEDVINFDVKPTPYFNESPERAHIYETRLLKKDWSRIWSKVQVTHTKVSLKGDCYDRSQCHHT